MKMNKNELLDDLLDRTQKATALVSIFQKMEESALQLKEDAKSWSVLECIDHLNRYYAFYLPLLNKALHNDKSNKTESFSTGWLGQFFVKLMEPKEGTIKKMKAMESMNPNGSKLDISVLQQFINHQEAFLQIMEQCKTINLNAAKLPTVMSKWITISLGDTLRFIVVHNERHLLQAQNCLKSSIAVA